MHYPGGFWLLGAVFLCTTGAEALYSDLGHCGKGNIRISWTFVKTTLLLNYLGQGAWLLARTRASMLAAKTRSYALMPPWFLLIGIGIATIAAIIASQALITGSFTLVAEAIRLNMWPKVKLNYPTDVKGQLFVPSMNRLLLAGLHRGGALLPRKLGQHGSRLRPGHHAHHADDHDFAHHVAAGQEAWPSRWSCCLRGCSTAVIEGSFLIANMVEIPATAAGCRWPSGPPSWP